MHTTNTRTQAGMRQALPHSDATYGGINAGSIETSLANAFFGTEQGAGCARTPLRPCRMRNAESGSDWNAGTDAEYEGGSGTGSGSGARAIAPWSAGAGDAILHALPEQGQGSGDSMSFQGGLPKKLRKRLRRKARKLGVVAGGRQGEELNPSLGQ